MGYYNGTVRGYLYKIISTEFISDAYDTHESIIEGSIWGGIADEIDTHK